MKLAVVSEILSLNAKGYSADKIAHIVGKSENSVRKCIKKAMISPYEMKQNVKKDCFAFIPGKGNIGKCDCLVDLECKYGKCAFYKTSREG